MEYINELLKKKTIVLIMSFLINLTKKLYHNVFANL